MTSSKRLSGQRRRVEVTDEVATEPAADVASTQTTNSAMFGRSMFYVFVGSLQLLITSLVSPALAYLLSPANFGSISLALAVYQVLYILAVFGFDQLLVIYDAQKDGGRNLALRLLATAICTAFVLCAGFALSEPYWRSLVGIRGTSSVLLAAVLWVGPSASNAFILALLRGQDRLRAFIVVSLISAVGGQTVGLVVLLTWTRSPAAYAWAGGGTQIIALIIGLALLQPPFRRLLGPAAFGTALRMSAPIAASAMAFYVLNTSDRILISHHLGTTAVAKYQVAYTVGSAILIVLSFLNGAWLPRLLRIDGYAELARVSGRSRDLLLFILTPTVTAVVLALPLLLRVVAPAEFGGASLSSVAAVVALSAFPVAHAGSTSRMLIVLGRRTTVAVATGLAGVLNVVLNIMLIPPQGILGSALATLISFAAQALLLSYLLDRVRSAFTVSSLVALVVGSGAAVGALALPRDGAWIWGRCAAAVVLGLIGARLLLTARSAIDEVGVSDAKRAGGAHRARGTTRSSGRDRRR